VGERAKVIRERKKLLAAKAKTRSKPPKAAAASHTDRKRHKRAR
jgi:hypothetical protein